MITISDIENDVEKINLFAEELLLSSEERVLSIKIEHVDEISTMLKNLNRVLSYYIKFENTTGNIHFSRGRLVGITEFLNCLLALYQKKKRNYENIEDISVAIKTVSHGTDILELLSLSRGIQHKELSSAVGIDNSTLTGIMDKLINLQVVDYNKIGKFKFYYLTEIGQKYKYEMKSKQIELIEELKRNLKEAQQQIFFEKEKYYQLLSLRKDIFETLPVKYIMSCQPNEMIMFKSKELKCVKKSKKQLLCANEKNNSYKNKQLCGAF